MKLREIIDAIGSDDKSTLRQAFRALVAPPGEEQIEASSRGMLVVALNRICGALAEDSAIMPPAVCTSLGLAPGASYAEGVRVAKAQWSRVSRAIIDR